MNNLQHITQEAVDYVIHSAGSLFVSDVLDDEDNVIGKFVLAYSEEGHPFVVSKVGNTLTIASIRDMKIVAKVERLDGKYSIPVDTVGLSKTSLIDLYIRMSSYMTHSAKLRTIFATP